MFDWRLFAIVFGAVRLMKNIYIYKNNEDSYYDKYLENLESIYGMINREKAIYLEYFIDNLLCVITIGLAVLIEDLLCIFIIALVLSIIITCISNSLKWTYVVENKENVHKRWCKSDKIFVCLACTSLAVVLCINNYYNQPREFLAIANPPLKIESYTTQSIYYFDPTNDKNLEISIEMKDYKKIIEDLSENNYKLKMNSDYKELDNLEFYNIVLYNSNGDSIFSCTIKGDRFLYTFDEKGVCRTYEVSGEKINTEFMRSLIDKVL